MTTHQPESSLAPVSIRLFTPEIAAQWDQFVLENPRGSFFQLSGWKRAVEKTFGYRALYSYAERDGRIAGIAPLFWIENWILGRSLISVPLGVYGGICADGPDSEQALLAHVKGLAQTERVDYLELRNRGTGLLSGFHANPLYVTFTAPISEDPEANLKRLPKDTRYMIRKAQKLGLKTQHGFEQLDAFYNLFAQNMKRHGTPVFPRSLFENLREEFPSQTDLMLVYAGTQPVAGVLSFRFRDTILPYYSGASLEATHLAANNFMYWELMQHSAREGARSFDFGRSKIGTGSYAFKSQWNMNVEHLDYQVYLVKRKQVPNFSPVNPKFQLATRVWQKLPSFLSLRLGPRVVRWFP